VNTLLPDNVVPRLRGRFGRDYAYFDEVPSTQRLLAGKREGAVVAAGHQTEGRGRLGRVWEDVPGTSLMFSIVLEPDVAGERLPELSVVAGEAVAAAITRVTGLATEVKLPNDVLVSGRKAAGILAEASEGRVVLGIGVNANQTADELPAETRVAPTSLRVEAGAPVERAELLVAILDELERRYDAWIRSG
jgi:BirA family biotin operon repressor/biotin-[acetyl-CoA-carboxylase] ligase